MSTTFAQPVGRRIDPEGVGGYYIDFRVKAREAAWPPPHLVEGGMWVARAQWGLGAYEHYLHTGEERWLAAAAAAGEHLVTTQRRGGTLDGAWVHERPYPHTYRLDPPWVSAMAQGEGASLLVRLFGETGEERFADAATRALRPLSVPPGAGGVGAELGGGPWYEEYPTDPPSRVLNGGIFALWGLRDVGAGLADEHAGAAFEEGLDSLTANLHRWDTGWWSAYDLFPHRVRNIASFAYHELHLDQLTAMQFVAPRPAIEERLERFEAYARSRASRVRAAAAKVGFRLLVPRR